MVVRNLRQLLAEIGQDSFYLLHLSWSGRERARLWQFAKDNSLIGLDYTNPDIDRKWPNVPASKKDRIGQTWRHQFDVFARMREGQCVVVAIGQSTLVGVGLVTGPYEFRPGLSEFFRHVRKVRWLLTSGVKYQRFMFSGFQNTIQMVKSGTRLWWITGQRLVFDREVPPKLKSKAVEQRKGILKKYGPRGEGADHRELKEWIADNPEALGLSSVAVADTEHLFQLSGDRVDIMFTLPNKRYAVVEIETNNPMPGAFQALKYRVLRCAELGLRINSSMVKGFLVAWHPPDDMSFCNKYKVRFVRKKL